MSAGHYGQCRARCCTTALGYVDATSKTYSANRYCRTGEVITGMQTRLVKPHHKQLAVNINTGIQTRE